MNEEELEKRRKISNELIKIFKPLVKETVYENYIDTILHENFEINRSRYNRGSFAVIDINEQLKTKTKEEVLIIIKDLIYSNIEVKSFEDFEKLTKYPEKLSIIKNKNMDFKNKIKNSSLIHFKRAGDYTGCEYITRCYIIINKGTALKIEEVVNDYYNTYLFFQNLDLYIKKGRYGDVLKQLCSSTIKTRGQYNDNDSPLADFESILLIENEEEFLKAMTNKLCDYTIGKSTEKSGFLTVEEYSWIMKKDMIIIYQFIITKETAKNYILTRDKLIYAKYNPINDRYKVNFETVFKPIVIPKNEDNEDFNVGEKIIIINYKENIINGRNFKSICYEGLYAVKAKDFLNQYKDHIENDKRINLCTKQDIEKIRDYFIQVLSKKNSNNSSSLNEKRKLKIKELEDQYYSISIPTHEDLLNICEKIDLNTEDFNHIIASNYEILKKFLKIKEREIIGIKLRELRKSQDNSEETLKVANKFNSLNISLNETQKKGAEAIFNKYYSNEFSRIEFEFPFERKYNSFQEEYKEENSAINQKIEILKTTCVKSDFDFS